MIAVRTGDDKGKKYWFECHNQKRGEQEKCKAIFVCDEAECEYLSEREAQKMRGCRFYICPECGTKAMGREILDYDEIAQK